MTTQTKRRLFMLVVVVIALINIIWMWTVRCETRHYEVWWEDPEYSDEILSDEEIKAKYEANLTSEEKRCLRVLDAIIRGE